MVVGTNVNNRLLMLASPNHWSVSVAWMLRFYWASWSCQKFFSSLCILIVWEILSLKDLIFLVWYMSSFYKYVWYYLVLMSESLQLYFFSVKNRCDPFADERAHDLCLPEVYSSGKENALKKVCRLCIYWKFLEMSRSAGNFSRNNMTKYCGLFWLLTMLENTSLRLCSSSFLSCIGYRKRLLLPT